VTLTLTLLQVVLDSEEEDINSNTVTIKIDPKDAGKQSFPQRAWFRRAMAKIEKDFTLRAENVSLRKLYVRPIKPVPVEQNISVEQLNSVEQQSSVEQLSIVEQNISVEQQSIVEQQSSVGVEVPSTRKKTRAPKIDLDIPNSFLEGAPDSSTPGFTDLFYQMVCYFCILVSTSVY